MLKINLNYAEIVPPLSKEEYEALKADISKRGLIYPIIVNEEGYIIDGHHRYKICNELGIKPLISVMEFSDELSEKEYVITVNLCRRQLNNFQIAELAIKLEDIEATRARQRQLAGIKISSVEVQNKTPLVSFDAKVSNEVVKGKTTHIVSKKVGLSPATYERARIIIKSSDEQLKGKLRSGDWSINRGFTEIRNQEKKNKLLLLLKEHSHNTSSNSATVKDRIMLFHGDCTKVCQEVMENSSIDLILTDPPYNGNSVYLYGKMAEIASRVLKPGGNLVMYASNYYLPQIFNEIQQYTELNWLWQFCVNHSGRRATIFPRHVFVGWKPLLWFVKGEQTYVVNSIYDFIQSETPNKTTHEWAQSTVEAEYIIKNLAPFEDQIILDPLMGDVPLE